MKKFLLKLALIVAVASIAPMPLEFWFRIFVLGRQYEAAPLY